MIEFTNDSSSAKAQAAMLEINFERPEFRKPRRVARVLFLISMFLTPLLFAYELFVSKDFDSSYIWIFAFALLAFIFTPRFQKYLLKKRIASVATKQKVQYRVSEKGISASSEQRDKHFEWSDLHEFGETADFFYLNFGQGGLVLCEKSQLSEAKLSELKDLSEKAKAAKQQG